MDSSQDMMLKQRISSHWVTIRFSKERHVLLSLVVAWWFLPFKDGEMGSFQLH